MRKKEFQKHMFAALLAAVSMASAVSFTACGKKDKNATSEEAKQKKGYVYESSFQDLGESSATYIYNTCRVDNTFYMYGEYSSYDEKKNLDLSKSYLMSCDMDGKELVSHEIDTSKLDKEEYGSTFFADGKGNLHLLTHQQKKNKLQSYMYDLSAEGKLSNKTQIKIKPKDNEDFYIRNVVPIGDMLYLTSDTKIIALNMDGSTGKTYDLSSDFDWVDTMFAGPDGQFYIFSYKGDKNQLFPLDLETGKLGDGMDFGDYQIYNLSNVQPGEGSIIYFTNENNLYQYDLSTGKVELLFNLVNVDIDPNNLSSYTAVENGGLKILSINTEWGITGNDAKSTMELATVKKVKASEAKQKETLTLAAAYLDENVKQKLLQYNKASEKSRIELKDYSTYEDPGKQLNLDIVSGKIPDIINTGNLPTNVYIKKGILADLYPLMEKDDEVTKDQFMESIINTVEKDGKLYFMPSSFGITGLAGSKKDFKDATSWTVDEMIERYEKLPKGKKFMNNMSREWFVYFVIAYQLDDYIDWSTGETHFDSEDFIKLIEFSKNFPAAEKMEEYEGDNAPSEAMLAKKGKLLLYNMDLYDIGEVQICSKLYKKQGGFTVLGYPNSKGSDKLSISLSVGSALAISDKCGNKDEAWQFVRQFLTYKYQKKEAYAIPTRKDAFEIKLEHAMAKEAYTDKDGDEVQPYQNGYGWSDLNLDLGPLSEEEAQMARDIVARVGKISSYDTVTSDISNIITEELEALYTGDKTAKDTAGVIQSRVKIYVSENL